MRRVTGDLGEVRRKSGDLVGGLVLSGLYPLHGMRRLQVKDSP